MLEVAKKFQQTPYRRLPVLDNQKLVGQVSRRDVISAEHQLAQQVAKQIKRGKDEQICNCDAPAQEFMDVEAKTITPAEDILRIAQIFLNTPYRRLAVLDSSKLVGQVSRRDLLAAAAALLRPTKHRKAQTLYLSPLTDTAPPSIGG